MQNVRPTDLAPAAEHLSPVSGAINRKFATVVEDRVRELATLDCYERRAISKRKSAIRAFDSAWISRSREITDLA